MRSTFAISDFSKLWIGQTISLFGSTFTGFALPTLAVVVLHANAMQVGILTALQMLPHGLLAMVAGAVADRLPRRTIMIVADVVRACALALVAVAAAQGRISMLALDIAALVCGCASVFFDVTYQSYLPAVVDVRHLTNANSKLELSRSFMSMAGVGIAGIVVQRLGAGVAIGCDAATYLCSVASLLAILTPEGFVEQTQVSIAAFVREVREGVAVVFQSVPLRAMLLGTSLANFGGAVAGAVTMVYAYTNLHLSPALLAIVMGAAQVGFFAAPGAGRLEKRVGLRGALVLCLVISSAATGVLLTAQLAAPYVMFFLAAFVTGPALTIYNILQVSYRQMAVPLPLQGRTNATMRTFMWGTIPLGAIVGGALGSILGVQAAIASAMVFNAVAALVVYRQLRA